MSALVVKLRILSRMIGSTFGEWRACVWQRDLDEYYCCNGGTGCHNICGCEGATVREVFSP